MREYRFPRRTKGEYAILRRVVSDANWWSGVGQPASPDPELLDKIAEALFIRRAAEWNISPRQAKILFYRQKEQGTLRYFALTRLATDVLTALRDMGYSVAAKSRS